MEMVRVCSITRPTKTSSFSECAGAEPGEGGLTTPAPERQNSRAALTQSGGGDEDLLFIHFGSFITHQCTFAHTVCSAHWRKLISQPENVDFQKSHRALTLILPAVTSHSFPVTTSAFAFKLSSQSSVLLTQLEDAHAGQTGPPYMQIFSQFFPITVF